MLELFSLNLSSLYLINVSNGRKVDRQRAVFNGFLVWKLRAEGDSHFSYHIFTSLFLNHFKKNQEQLWGEKWAYSPFLPPPRQSPPPGHTRWRARSRSSSRAPPCRRWRSSTSPWSPSVSPGGYLPACAAWRTWFSDSWSSRGLQGTPGKKKTPHVLELFTRYCTEWEEASSDFPNTLPMGRLDQI